LISIQTGRQTRSNVYFYRHESKSRKNEKKTNNSFFFFFSMSNFVFTPEKTVHVCHLDINNTSILTLKKVLVVDIGPELKATKTIWSKSTFIFIDLHSNLKNKMIMLQIKRQQIHTHTRIYRQKRKDMKNEIRRIVAV